MFRSLLSLGMFLAVLLLGTGVFASGEGGHAHDHQQQNGTGVVTYVDSQDGVDAYFEVCDRQLPDRDKWTGFVVKCDLRAYFKNAATGAIIDVARVAIRSTVDHGQFGEARALKRTDQEKMETNLIIKDHGLHHFLLIVDIPGAGKREFHFHHNFT